MVSCDLPHSHLPPPSLSCLINHDASHYADEYNGHLPLEQETALAGVGWRWLALAGVGWRWLALAGVGWRTNGRAIIHSAHAVRKTQCPITPQCIVEEKLLAFPDRRKVLSNYNHHRLHRDNVAFPDAMKYSDSPSSRRARA